MNTTVIVFMIIASIFAVGTIGYVIFDIVHEAHGKDGTAEKKKKEEDLP